MKVKECGMFISLPSPNGIICHRMDSSNILGLLEIKCPFNAMDKTVAEACKSSSFCLQENSLKLKPCHDYFYQVQCQLHCVDCEWCDFVVKAGKDTHTQRIYRDREWWKLEMVKLKQFYFNSLLPELASPRFKKGGNLEWPTPIV